jgi:hypothetical protein
MVVHCPSSGQFFQHHRVSRARLASRSRWGVRCTSDAAGDDASPHFSLLKEAALVEARGGPTATCQVNDIHAAPCLKKAEVKLADPAGDTVWACLTHADEILVTVPGSFIASQDEQGIGWFLSRRRG